MGVSESVKNSGFTGFRGFSGLSGFPTGLQGGLAGLGTVSIMLKPWPIRSGLDTISRLLTVFDTF